MVEGLDNTIIINSINKGEIKGNTETGGIVGYNCGSITNCANLGKIKATSGVGGNSRSILFYN